MRDLKIDIMNDQDETWMCRKKRLEALASRSRRFIGEKQQMEVHDHGVKAHDREVKRLMNTQIYQSIEKDDDADVFIGTLEKVSLLENLSLSDILWQVTPSEGSLLHVAARYGSGDIIQLLAHFLPELIFQKNNQDETPLHEAARAGQLNATKMLIRFAKDNGGKDHGDSFVSKKNLKLNTALHLALIHGKQDVAKFLVSEDQEVCYYLNKLGTSPLCLAVSNGNTQMLDCLLDALIISPSKCDELQEYWRKPPVHLAMKIQNEDILMKIAGKQPELLHIRDKKGENALHYASWIGYVRGVEIMLQNNSEAELETNNDGDYPVHLACKKGHEEVLKKLLDRWIQDPTEFLNKKGQNILHIAAENGQDRLITDIFEKTKANNILQKLLNQRDDDGNTPLHLATIKGHCIAVYTLVNADGMKKRMRNNQMLTPYAIASAQAKKKELSYQKDDNDKGGTKQEVDIHVTDAHTQAKNPDKEKQQSTTVNPKRGINYFSALMTFAILFYHARPPCQMSLVQQLRTMFSKPDNKKEMKRKIENLLVVAILIAGATFAGGLDLPKENKIEDAKGLAEYREMVAMLFLIFNMLSFNLAVIAFIILCWSGSLATKISSVTVVIASMLISLSIYYMTLAFSFAFIIDMAKYITSFAVVITVLVFFLVVQTVVAIPLFLTSNVIRFFEKLVAPYLYYLFFRIYMLIHPCVTAMDRQQRKCQQANLQSRENVPARPGNFK